MNKIGIVSWVL